MSVYYLNKILYLIETDREFLERFREDTQAAIANMPLTAAERTALLSGDVAGLYRMGVHAFLLNSLARHLLCGLDRDRYLERIRQAG
jgi:hypothetical protein